MKKIFIAVIFIASFSRADIIRCTFTEPFVNTIYSTTQSTLTYKNIENKTKIIRNVSFQIKAAGVFELVAKNGKILQTLTLNNNGSDGMSDTVYPYEVKDTSMIIAPNNGFGGCSSNYLKPVTPKP